MKVAFGVACLGLAAFLAGQEGGRQPHIARVQGIDGKPLAGAEVTFAATEGLGPDGVDDVVRAVSDERGRARVDLLRGRDYRGYATWRGADQVRVTKAVRRSVTTTEFDFAAANKVRTQWDLQGVGPWRKLGPLTIEFVPLSCDVLTFRCAIGEANTLEVPPLCGDDLVYRVFVGEQLVHAGSHSNHSNLSLQPPREVRLLVVDADGKPVAGAVVDRVVYFSDLTDGLFPGEIAPRRFTVATTDAEGRARLWVSHRQDPFAGIDDFPGIPFVARKAGYEEAWSGFTKAPYCDSETRKADELDGTLRFTLNPVPIEKGKVLARGEARPDRLLLRVENSVPGGGTSSYRARDTVKIPLAADGGFAMPRFRGKGVALVVPGVVPEVALDDPFRRSVAPRAMVLPADALDEANGIDLRQVMALRLQFVDANAGPARGAAVLCSPKGSDGYVQATGAMRATADAAGRIVFPVLAGKWLVVALLDGAWVQAEIEVDVGLEVQTLKLEPLPCADVRVIDGEGKPVADATFRISGGSWSSSSETIEAFVTEIAHEVNAGFLARARTDADGRARIPMLVCRGVRTDFEVRRGLQRAGKQVLRPEDPIEFVLR